MTGEVSGGRFVAMIEHGFCFVPGQIEVKWIPIYLNGYYSIDVVAENGQGLAGGHSGGNNCRGQRGWSAHRTMRVVGQVVGKPEPDDRMRTQRRYLDGELGGEPAAGDVGNVTRAAIVNSDRLKDEWH